MGLAPLRRLTRREYENTLHDLVGYDGKPGQKLSTDAQGPSGFATPGVVSAVDADGLLSGADEIGQYVLSNLDQVAPCDRSKSSAETACVDTFVRTFGRRAYRRALTGTEVTDLKSLFTTARTTLGDDYPDAVRVVVEAMLQSPNFLYRWEVGDHKPDGSEQVVMLTADQIASRLSYFLWGSMPDDELFAAVDAGELQTVDQVEKQARRMLRSDRARDAIESFHTQWLSLEGPPGSKDPDLYPDFDDSTVDAMGQETRAMVDDVLLKGDHKLSTLFTAPIGFVNDKLAPIYGLSGISGSALQKKNLDPNQRAGLLTQVNFLARQASSTSSHPVKRGLIIWERLVCGHIPPPPANVPALKPPIAGATTRQRFAAHDQNACASSCHGLMDPPGFALENFDAIGQYRDQEAGQNVDASGTLKLPKDGPKPFTGFRDFTQALAHSEDLRQCVTRQWFRYALGRQEEDAEAGSLNQAYAPFSSSDFDLQELIVEIAKTKAFLYRTLADGEVSP